MSAQNCLNTVEVSSHTHAAGHGSKVSSAEIAAALGERAPSPLQNLVAHARRVSFAPQEVLYRQGNASDTVLFITGGLVKLVAHLSNGRARIVRLHRPGSIMGLSGLLKHDHAHTAVAVTPVSALRLPMGALHRLRADDPTTYVTLVERWYGYLREADTWITQFSTGPIRARVARLVSYLSEFQHDSADIQVQLLTCEEMGFILGVTTESVSRTLADFKRRNILVNQDNSGADELYSANVEQLHVIASE
jgi:CRP/FNR family transcriptional regulator